MGSSFSDVQRDMMNTMEEAIQLLKLALSSEHQSGTDELRQEIVAGGVKLMSTDELEIKDLNGLIDDIDKNRGQDKQLAIPADEEDTEEPVSAAKDILCRLAVAILVLRRLTTNLSQVEVAVIRHI